MKCSTSRPRPSKRSFTNTRRKARTRRIGTSRNCTVKYRPCSACLSHSRHGAEQQNTGHLFDDVWKEIKRAMKKKNSGRKPDHAAAGARRILMVIDNLWKDHLYEMDHLKGACSTGHTVRRTHYTNTSVRHSRHLKNCATPFPARSRRLFRVEAVRKKTAWVGTVEDHARRIRHFLFGRSPPQPQQQAQQRPHRSEPRRVIGGGKPCPSVSSGRSEGTTRAGAGAVKNTRNATETYEPSPCLRGRDRGGRAF